MLTLDSKKLKIRNFKSEIRKQKIKIRNKKSEIRQIRDNVFDT